MDLLNGELRVPDTIGKSRRDDISVKANIAVIIYELPICHPSYLCAGKTRVEIRANVVFLPKIEEGSKGSHPR
jgi:hypothetical protein